jgi:hypothetical protein
VGHGPSRSWLRRGRLLLPNLLVIVSVVGILAYAVLRSYYSVFYGPLGVTPEDVGLGYVEVLQLSYAGLFLAAAVFLILAALLTVLIILQLTLQYGYIKAYLWLLKTLTRGRANLQSPEFSDRISRMWRGWGRLSLRIFDIALAARPGVLLSRHFLGRLMLGAFIFTVVLGAALLNVIARDLSRDAIDGKPVFPPTLFGARVLFLRAEPAQVWWTNNTTSPSLQLNLRPCLRYLGQSNGITVFYDSKSACGPRHGRQMPTPWASESCGRSGPNVSIT